MTEVLSKPTGQPDGPGRGVRARLQADVVRQWSWAAAHSRIPQISQIVVELSAAVENLHVTVRVFDGDVVFGSVVAFEGGATAGVSRLRPTHVPLSASVMARVDERREAKCVVEVGDASTGTVIARTESLVEIQPRDLWFWDGDPRRTERRNHLRYREQELLERWHMPLTDDERAQVEDGLLQVRAAMCEVGQKQGDLARSLLASYVRPNHPEVAAVAREAATLLEAATGNGSFAAFQSPDVAAAEKRVEETVNAVYEALKARSIAYSEPPPRWDYASEGQPIRDHGDVARGGLGTCMDTTVLMAAVLEHVGLMPVLVFVPGHIFLGYWRRNPFASRRAQTDWHPDTPVIEDIPTILQLVEGGFLGLIETTVLTLGHRVAAADAKALARTINVRKGTAPDPERWPYGPLLVAVDVTVARRAGVSPLPVLHQQESGETVVVVAPSAEGPRAVEVPRPSAPTEPSRPRVRDNHPARYRGWKGALFSLNATNALLNLGQGHGVQPLVVPPGALGELEDMLNQDVEFSLKSGYDLPEVYRAREIANALELEPSEVIAHLRDRKLYAQRFSKAKSSSGPVSQTVFSSEIRAMQRKAKEAHDERGMNPLFLCIGLLRWTNKPGQYYDAPLILVPVKITARRGRGQFALTLDASAQTTPNAALIEWLRREHDVVIPALAGPAADRAGIDVDGVLSEVRAEIARRGLPFEVTSEARLALLDLSAFRMWQDLNRHAETFLAQPLVNHLVHTPTEAFQDSRVVDDGERIADELDQLHTPIPADATQKRAVLWAREGRTFVLQGPPGTGKSQTITNMVAESVLAGKRVLFVAEKGTALSVVQRRLDAIGLSPFTLNLHHEGSSAAQVRSHLKRSLTSRVMPDPVAMEAAARRLRGAHFELSQYPLHLHRPNAAGYSAYSAHDQLHVLGDGPRLDLRPELVTYRASLVQKLRDLLGGLQPRIAAAGVRPDHPWRFVGMPPQSGLDLDSTSASLRAILDCHAWADGTTGDLRAALDSVTHPNDLAMLARATHGDLPVGQELAAVLEPAWRDGAEQVISACEQAVRDWTPHLRGCDAAVLDLDLRGMSASLDAASSTGVFGRSKRRAAVLGQLGAFVAAHTPPSVTDGAALLSDLIAVQDAKTWVARTLVQIPGFFTFGVGNPFADDTLHRARQRFDELAGAAAPLMATGEWAEQVRRLAISGVLVQHRDQLLAYASSWWKLWRSVGATDEDLTVWLGGDGLQAATRRHREAWQHEVEHERLLVLQRWCDLVRALRPITDAGIVGLRSEILDGTMRADRLEEAFERGLASVSEAERVHAEGLDRFDARAHDARALDYAAAEAAVRRQWITDGPAKLLERRGAGGLGDHTGGLARELEKTRNKLGTRALLRRYGAAVQELTPLVLCSPSSAVDLIEPGVMEFDTVIFDEASQIAVPAAIGVIGRARSVVVVGDSKQMPPMKKVGAGPATEESPDETDLEIVEDEESILSECELARVPTLRLSWHYRSQDEALIAFSNGAYYGGELSSFPTPTLLSSATGVEFVRVDGQFIRSTADKRELPGRIAAGIRTNPTEALAIVARVRSLLAEAKPPTVGIVTFNEQQRQLIEDLLTASGDGNVKAAMDESAMGPSDVLFIKTLEQVQGDERDVVLFSVAFSKNTHGKIPLNFGPLSNSGGERRLNVAVTRARRKNLVFCSFDPEDLDADSASFRGVKDLKQFLLFARAAGRSGGADLKVDRRPVRDRHRDDVAEALRSAGLHVMTDVGMSGFRLDLVLSRPESPERVVLPVLLDGETWRQRETVSDRDVLPVEVLRDLMGWPAVARIWWPMWLQNRQEVIDEILTEFDAAEQRFCSDVPSDVVDVPEVPTTPVQHAVGEHDIRSAGPLVQHYWREAETPLPEAPEAPDGAQHPVVAVPPTMGLPPAVDDADFFAAAHTDVVGPREVLDALPARAASVAVTAQLLDVIETEGPVELGRLVRIVARRFGLGTVRASRFDEISRLVPRACLHTGPLGTFAWPSSLDPETWNGFRPVTDPSTRSLDETSPEEIANAMRGVARRNSGLGVDALLRATAQVFGVTRLGASARPRLERVYRTISEF